MDLFKLIDTTDERLAWEYTKLAKYLNEPYSKVKALPADEHQMLVRLMEINSLCGSEEGVNVLKLNIRLQQTTPDVDKLKEKVGKGV